MEKICGWTTQILASYSQQILVITVHFNGGSYNVESPKAFSPLQSIWKLSVSLSDHMVWFSLLLFSRLPFLVVTVSTCIWFLQEFRNSSVGALADLSRRRLVSLMSEPNILYSSDCKIEKSDLLLWTTCCYCFRFQWRQRAFTTPSKLWHCNRWYNCLSISISKKKKGDAREDQEI